MTKPALLVALAALTASAAFAQPDTKPTPPADPTLTPTEFKGLVVHEWGTFTSYSGPSGDIVPFNVQIGENLPKFVQARNWDKGWLPANDGGFIKEVVPAEQRMETPVIYFYSGQAMEVSALVSMPRGLITEVYPPVTAATPERLTPQYTCATGSSSVRWDHVSIMPTYCCDTIGIANADGSHYDQARATRANKISIKHGEEVIGERFLFYRGIGSGDMGLKARPLGNDRFIIDRSDNGPLAAAFAIEVSDGHIRFTQVSNLKPGVEFALPKESATPESLAAAMIDSLAKAGLYKEEATAMVNTWKHLWFSENGTRVLAILPQATIDAALPLTITPSATQTKRVFVSRLEMLTPEAQRWVQDLITRQDAAPLAERDAISAQFTKLGRFQGPAITIARNALAHPKLLTSAPAGHN